MVTHRACSDWIGCEAENKHYARRNDDVEPPRCGVHDERCGVEPLGVTGAQAVGKAEYCHKI